MAEFCLECWNKIMGTQDTECKFVMTRDLELCEECGEWKRVIVVIKTRYLLKEWFEDIAFVCNERRNNAKRKEK